MQSHEELQQGKRSSPNTSLEILREQVSVSALLIIKQDIWARLGAFAIYIFMYLWVCSLLIHQSYNSLKSQSVSNKTLMQKKKDFYFHFFVRELNLWTTWKRFVVKGRKKKGKKKRKKNVFFTAGGVLCPWPTQCDFFSYSEQAAMKFQALFFLLLFTCMCLSLAQGEYCITPQLHELHTVIIRLHMHLSVSYWVWRNASNLNRTLFFFIAADNIESC